MAENESFVVRVTATDANTSDRIESFTLSGDDAASFTIVLDRRDGVLSFTAAPDFETPTDTGGNNVYDVSIIATSGTGDRVSESAAVAFTITVTNVNEPPVITSTGDTFSVPENSTDVTTVTADDLDSDDSVTGYTLDGDDASRFAITAGGVLTFAVAPNFEDPKDTGGPNGDNVYVVIVKALGGAAVDGRQMPSEGQTVTVTNVDEGAEVLGDTDREVTEAGGKDNADRGTPTAGDTFDFVERVDTVGVYGTFSITAAGRWTYTLDDDRPATEALDEGDRTPGGRGRGGEVHRHRHRRPGQPHGGDSHHHRQRRQRPHPVQRPYFR